MQIIDFIIVLVVLIGSVILHEVAHGFVARLFGDHTAEYAGRLTLNPIAHIDLLGSIIVPAVAFLTTGAVFGWAKPVPVNVYNLNPRRAGEICVALAGVGTNFALAIIAGLVIRIFGGALPAGVFSVALYIVEINLILGVFNLVPIPPLDGSRIWEAFAPYRWRGTLQWLDRYGFFIIVIFILFGWQLVLPLINFLITLLTGI